MSLEDKDKQPQRENRLLDSANGNIKHLVWHRNNNECGESIVYVDNKYDLEWECDDLAEQKLEQVRRELGNIQNGIARLEPIAANWPCDLKLSTKRVLGEAIARMIQGDTATASEALIHAQQFVSEKSKQVSRFWTLKACMTTGAFAFYFLALEITLRQYFETALSRTTYLISLCFWIGCIGALLFVILKLGKETKADSTAEQHLHYFEGGARILAGGISGAFVGVMIKMGLILPIFSQVGMEGLAMCAGALIAGASERFAAGIITNVENDNSPRERSPNGDN